MQARSWGQALSIWLAILTGSIALSTSAVSAAGLQDDVNQAITILERFQDIPEKSIPTAVLKDARGLAILTVIKAGFVVSGRGGSGLVIARTATGWSGPSAIGTGGAGFGFQIGLAVSEFVIVLNTDAAVKAFSHDGNIVLGTNLSVAAGPVGRSLEAGVAPVAAVYTYSRSQGLFAGVSLEGTIIVTRDGANSDYYGREVDPERILSGNIVPPPSAQPLIKLLEVW